MTDASLRARDGVELAYTLQRAGHESLALVVPGILTDRRCAELQLLARELLPLADVATLDVRGHGDSGGAFSYGRHEPEDVAEWVRALAPQYRELVLIGFSFGGLHALMATARNAGLVARVATVAAPAHLALLDHLPSARGLLRNLPWMARRRRRLTRLALPRGLPPVPLRLVARIAPTPLLLIHGLQDWLVPPSHARRLFAAAREPKALELIEGGLHAEYMLAADPEPLLAPLRCFVRGRLGTTHP